MVRQVYLRPDEDPPENEEYVLISITAPGHVTVASQSEIGFQSVFFIERDSTGALAKAMTTAQHWAEALGIDTVLIKRNAGLAPDA